MPQEMGIRCLSGLHLPKQPLVDTPEAELSPCRAKGVIPLLRREKPILGGALLFDLPT